jgi:hypothetical protein
LDEIAPFYEALGFMTTYRQERPNPYLVVRRADLQLHFAGIDGFDPEQSYGSVILVVPDADALYGEFTAGLRAAFGRVPSSGIPRLLRPRRKRGTVSGFSVVDPGGNWLRVYRRGDAEDEQPVARGLALAVESAARLGDAKGDDIAAARMLDAALRRHDGAPATERLPALVYRAELAARLGDTEGARTAVAAARGLSLDDEERERLAADLATLAEL